MLYLTITIYVADLELHGVLIFSTEQRPSLTEEGGAVISTGHFIHNYPLIYGFANKNVEAYTIISSLHHRQGLHYGSVEEQLKRLLEGDESIYVYPAFPLKVTTRKFFMTAKGTGYAEFRGALKTVFPRLEHYVTIVPPSRFRTIILAQGIELPKQVYIRIGMKRMGLFKVILSEAEIIKQINITTWSNIPVNLYDIGLFGYVVDDLLKVLETRSKPTSRPTSSVIGYIKTSKLFIIRHKTEEYKIPLPLRLIKIDRAV